MGSEINVNGINARVAWKIKTVTWESAKQIKDRKTMAMDESSKQYSLCRIINFPGGEQCSAPATPIAKYNIATRQILCFLLWWLACWQSNFYNLVPSKSSISKLPIGQEITQLPVVVRRSVATGRLVVAGSIILHSVLIGSSDIVLFTATVLSHYFSPWPRLLASNNKTWILGTLKIQLKALCCIRLLPAYSYYGFHFHWKR